MATAHRRDPPLMDEAATFDLLVSRAMSLMEIKRFGEAASSLRRAIALEPGSSAAFCLLSACLLESGDPEAALEAAGGAVAADPDEEWAHRRRALALLEVDRKAEALEAAREAVRLNPLSSSSTVVLAFSALASGDKKLASASAERAVELDPEDVEAHNALTHVALARRKWKAAERHARRALEIDPENADALNSLGVALYRLGRRHESIDHFTSASRVEPAHPSAWENAIAAARAVAGGSAMAGAAVALIFRRTLGPWLDELPMSVWIGVWSFMGAMLVWAIVIRIRTRREREKPSAFARDLVRRERREARSLRSPVNLVMFLLFGLFLCGISIWGLTFNREKLPPGNVVAEQVIIGIGAVLVVACAWGLIRLARRPRT